MEKKIYSLLLIACITCSALAQIPTDSLVAYYKFSGNAADSSGHLNHGTNVQAILANDRFGNPNSAYSFDGKDDYIYVDSTKALAAGRTPQTVAAWFLSTGNQNSTGQFVSIGAAAPTQGLQVGLVSGDLTVSSYGTGNAWTPTVAGITIFDGQWHHCAVVYNGVKTEFYVDGEFKDSTIALVCSTATDSMYIGRDLGANWQYFKGSLDDITIYAKALAAAEVAKLYDLSDSTIQLIPIASPTNEKRPVFAWYTSPSATVYTLRIDTTANLANPFIVAPIQDTTYTPTIDLPTGTIYWQVTGNNGLVSPISSFVIMDQNVPVPVPFDPNLIIEVRPQFKWHPVSGATSYNLDIDSSIDFSTMILTVPVSDTFYTPLIDLPAATLYWRVKSNLSPQYSESEVVHIQPDSIPFLYRFNGDTAHVLRPDFKWKPVSGATIYQIELDTVGDFAAPFLSVPTSDTAYNPSIDLWDMKLYWHVSSNRTPGVFCLKDSLIVSTITEIHLIPDGNGYTKKVVTYYQDSPHKLKIVYNAQKQTRVQVEIYSITGRLIRRIGQVVDQKNRVITWDGRDRYNKPVSAGTYIVRVSAEGRHYYQKVNVLF